jgi:hypothetical protein
MRKVVVEIEPDAERVDARTIRYALERGGLHPDLFEVTADE